MIPQNLINAYANGPAAPQNGQFKEGDIIANFPGCDKDGRDCAKEQQTYFDILDRTS
jgi:mannan polymerase II complex MNN11 subunit